MSIPVALSTASVYPESVEAGFAIAAELGYDGVELMVWADRVSQDVAAVERLSRRYGVPVLAVHAPCLIVTQRIWGSDPVKRLDRARVLASNTEIIRWCTPFPRGTPPCMVCSSCSRGWPRRISAGTIPKKSSSP